jgi:hypothetical protein
MFGWAKRAVRAVEAVPGAGAASLPTPAIVHDMAQVQILGLLVTDTYRWKRDWATWRVRFAYSNEHAGLTFRDVAAFVREAAAALCQHRCDCAEIVLYLSHLDDLKAVFATYGAIPHGIGQISAIQGRDSYLRAAALAAELAGLSRTPDRGAEDEVASLPDLSWHVDGFGMARIATTELRGRRVVVRLGVLSGQEFWVVDVNDRPACARFRSRLDAMSKMGVASALRAYESRPR